MVFQLRAYMRFLWESKNEHGVHSPFVFSLVTKCFYDRNKLAEYALLERFRNSLRRNQEFIEVTDFGAGSKVFKSNKRKVSKIAETAGISPKRAALLLRVVKYIEPADVLEVGTSLGLGTSALSLGNPAAAITTLEGCPETARVAKQQFEVFGLKNINAVVTDFETYLNEIPRHGRTYQLIYFDGNHTKNATLSYFESLLHTAANDSVWIFDDIHWSADMEAAWEAIKKHPEVTVTIDTFQWGFVFFRREQQKEHFVIRV
ncbi:class I SAM-dependent methyltransferase [Flavobacterium sp.]|uniref:O-methyltransferase n=1 Tax=Flavobacterium sp. TaxID=239 RepID=UPI0026100813|nr:class I SAM-dependent methyltransferase [Flavobacterium sp.]